MFGNRVQQCKRGYFDKTTRKREVVTFAAVMSLVAAWTILAFSGLESANQKRPQEHTLSTASFSAASPSKEYIYAGSRLVATEEPARFVDVADGSLFAEDIYKIAARGVTVGCSTNPPMFCPDQSVTREQMAAFIIRALGDFNPPAPPSQRFIDVPPNNPFYAFIDEMAVRQITVGCPAPSYCPGSQVPHQEIAAFIMRARGEFTPPTPPAQRFTDVPVGNVFYKFIDRMAVLNIWPGCGGGNYCPGAPVTRREMAHILVQAFGF